MIEEPNKEQTLNILKGIKQRYENHHQVKISEAALKKAVELADKYISDRVFPDKAIDLMDEACAKVKLHSIEKKSQHLSVEPQDIENVMSEWKEIGLDIKQSENKKG